MKSIQFLMLTAMTVMRLPVNSPNRFALIAYMYFVYFLKGVSGD